MKINEDSPVILFFDKVTDILLAGFYWLLCSLPVVTIGPASCALYYTIVKVVRRKRDTVSKAFFHSFRENLKQGMIATILYLFYAGVIAVYLFLNTQQHTLGVNPYVFLLAGVMLILPFLLSGIYIFPVISRFGCGLGKQFQYAFTMSVGHLFTTIILLVGLSAVCFAVYLLPFLLLILPGIYAFVSSLIIERTFKTYMRNERKKYKLIEDLPWYLE
ncbi:MAG: YesL family protein [Lachnospiraceae bacterium]|nr:YesL family protein [Lachnospiraceae bacterium]